MQAQQTKVKAVEGDCKFTELTSFYQRFSIILIDKHRIHKFSLMFLCSDIKNCCYSQGKTKIFLNLQCSSTRERRILG